MPTEITVNDDGTVVGYLTTSDIAKEWGVTDSTVRVWIKRGKLKALKVGSINLIDQYTPIPEPINRKKERLV